MNKPKLYRAVFPVPCSADGPTLGELFLRGRIEQYLRDNNLENHLINMYQNHDRLVVVLNSRNTAMMIKLAIT